MQMIIFFKGTNSFICKNAAYFYSGLNFVLGFELKVNHFEQSI